MNASFSPSGENAGSSKTPLPSFSATWPLPFGRIVNRCASPLRSDTNTILLPSGDQAGSQSSAGLSTSRFSVVVASYTRE